MQQKCIFFHKNKTRKELKVVITGQKKLILDNLPLKKKKILLQKGRYCF